MNRQVAGRSYGQRVPPLTSVIKSILERYPDGGQILKEIIQNADDASATSISFLLDSRQQPYGTASLYNPELAKFQGPALYSSNNAKFTKEDWSGLESLMDSGKKDEPLKVGRFGIGFNSIYHVTDLPSVVSGDRLAFLDPHEVYFGKKETGQQFDLNEPLLQDYYHQFSPFEDVLGYKISQAVLEGTLFRFPLRNEASKLSQKNYSTSKVRNLFQSLKEEASLILLFLKNIEEINIYETNDTQREKLVFSVRLDECCRAEVRKQRQNLLRDVPKWENETKAVLKLNLEMVIHIFDSATGTRQEKWLTHNRIGDSKSKMHQKALTLHLLPWIGFAAPLTVEEGKNIGKIGGRLFCFLPLPPDADSRTGYPVHIHGYFGLTDNRRGLKWPGAECQNDDMAEWNVDLMKYVGSEAYATLLQVMTTHLPRSVSQDMIQTFYQCWPDKQFVHKHWKDIIDVVFKRLLRKSVFWSSSSGGQWLSLQEAVFYRPNLNPADKSRSVVQKVLHLANEPVVYLPPHVDAYLPLEAQTVTPMYFRTLLKKNRQASWDINSMNRQEKIVMLEYILKDLKNFADLNGIALLPLSNGCFSSFKAGSQCNPNDVVYVENQRSKMTLLPGMETRFLDPRIQANVLSSLTKLHNSARQLVHLEPQTVISLLRQVLPKEFFLSSDPVVWYPSQGGHPSLAWLEQLWIWLYQNFTYDLSQFEGFPIIECSSAQYRTLVKLTIATKIIRQVSNEGASLPSDVITLLKKAGINVLPNIPSYMKQHPCFSTYVADASPEGVLKVLRNVASQRSMAAITRSTIKEKRSLREFLSLLRTSLSGDSQRFLKSLPIYKAIDRTSFISAQNRNYTAPRGLEKQISIKIKNASTILSVEDGSSYRLLLNILGVPPLTMAQFLTQEIFPFLSDYTTQQVTSLMCWVLRRIDVFRNEKHGFCEYLSRLDFVDAGEQTLSSPKDLFNPRSQFNKRLFEGEVGKFPVNEFAKDDVLVQLRALGLKTTLDEEDVVHLVDDFQCFNFGLRSRKALALLQFLEEYPDLLERAVGDTNTVLRSYLQDVEWVLCKENRPSGYPEYMPWMSVRNRLLRPNEVVSLQHSSIVGAVMAVLQYEPSIHIQKAFKWNKTPESSKVFEQLRIACTEVDVKSLQRKDKDQFWRMLKLIYESFAVYDEGFIDQEEAEFPWIWNGNGFSSPDKVAHTRQTNFDLKPYLYTIPDEMQELYDFFTINGVEPYFSVDNLLDVLHEIKVKHDRVEVNQDVIDRDKQLALDILHWIVRSGPLDTELRDNVYVPVMNDPANLKLVPLSESTFCDADWLRGNTLELQMLPELCELSLIDESISNATASNLGVPPMSQCVTAPETLGFEHAGPYEPITRRLKNILDEYKEGAGVFKELVQNADDAEATEVKFLVDWRHHPTERVLAKGMKEAQGPALLTYNNASFTSKDFENINKLAGATKKENLEKIGRFGLGFNSVYHFTDTPSFVSSKYAVFFDPDTKHLGNFITSPSHPGIKLNLGDNRTTLLCYPDQFKPYDGVFDCDVSGKVPFSFNGTLFRFPFRHSKSEICDKQYNKQDVDTLLESFRSSASTLLLNTQNVHHVSVWELDEHATDPTDMKLLMKIDRTVLWPSQTLNKTTFLHDCATWSKYVDEAVPQRTKIIYTTLVTTDGHQQNSSRDYWLQCDRMGDGESLEIASSKEGKDKGLLSCAGVTVNLKRVKKTKFTWETTNTDGEAFCFLPLSIPTGLPVHVNGYLAVNSNRRAIWEETAEESHYFRPIEVRWNKALMNDGIAQAYLQVLKQAKQLSQNGNLPQYDFCSLWPDPARLHSHAWKPLVIGVYSLVARSSFPLVKSRETWYTVKDCIYPSDDLKKIPGSLEILQQLDYKIVNLPQFARNGFSLAQCGDQIHRQTMSQKKFLEDVFFPKINTINGALRDKVVCFVIDRCLTSGDETKKVFFRRLLSSNSCIPCSSNHNVLEKPGHLVHPAGDAASLYLPNDNKIPVGECLLEPKRLLVLEKLGMAKDNLSWNHICERAQSVENLPYHVGLDRVSKLITYLNKHISKMPSVDGDTTLSNLRIFPVMPKPETWFCPWEGEETIPKTLLPGTELYDKAFTNIVGSLKPILDESSTKGCGILNPQVKKLFQIESKFLCVNDALKQLHLVSGNFTETDNCLSLQRLTTSICKDIYRFLQSAMEDEEAAIFVKISLEGSKVLFVEDRFVSKEKLAFEWDVFGAPYLYRVPLSLHPYRKLLEDLGVKQNFQGQDILMALKEIKTDNKDQSLNATDFKIAKEFLYKLNKSPSLSEMVDGCTPMPDQERILRPAKDLVINDAPWVKVSDDVRYVHKDISIDLAHSLRANDIRSKSLEGISRSIGEPFGQKELLTDRLSGILKSYPCDFGILKELLQNADDAKATAIHFVYDPRQHSGTRLFTDSWRELQGPALCVYNDRPFSERDIEGIQRLGIGSKADSPEKTGQYGIGFNSVYHLTDCPSFITDGQTLCILDPHARYAPGATKENPGRLIGPFKEDDYANYQDVFPGYLGGMFDLKGATMFRFPLRNKEMASKSDISKKEILSHIEPLLGEFQREAKETLLFLNYVKKISISKIVDQQLKLVYEVSADLENKDEIKRRDLADHVKKTKHVPTREIERFEIFYPITLKDYYEEKWLVQQTVGIFSEEKQLDIPDGRQYGLLPRAGVAAKVSSVKDLSERTQDLSWKPKVKDLSSVKDLSERRQDLSWKPKAFCFLPLPVTTDLPVHVNGHFALDSGRRHLWHDDDTNAFKTKWNHFIKTGVIADAYISFMIGAREHVPLLKRAEEFYFSNEYEARVGLEWYEGLFPSQLKSESQWKTMAVAVLTKVVQNDKKVLPLIRRTKIEMGLKHVCAWLSPSNCFFPNSYGQHLSSIVRNIGFKLVSLTNDTYQNFIKANAPVKEMTSESLLKFLSTHEPLLNQLPCQIENSSIGSVANVLALLEYCMKSPAFAKNLEGVPLLYTRDGILRVFTKQNQVYISKFLDLVRSPAHYEKFADIAIVTTLRPVCKDLFEDSHPVAKPLTLTALVKFLPFNFKERRGWCPTNVPVAWDLTQEDRDVREWLTRLWLFIAKEHKQNPSDRFLEPLEPWPVIPTKDGHLFPVSLSKTVLNLTASGSWSYDQKNVVKILRYFRCPEVDIDMMESEGESVSNVVRTYLAYPNVVDDVVNVLDSLMTREHDISGRIKAYDATRLLQFLQEDSQTLQASNTNLSVLRKLPFYKTIDGRMIKLDSASSICKVPTGIPLEESELWMEGTRNIFLEPNQSLDLLHQLLGVELKSHVSCYIEYIFPVFHLLKESTRMEHLSYIKDNLLHGDSAEVKRMVSALKTLECIPDVTSRRLHRVSHYYDPRNPVFMAMLSKDKFPPKPFCTVLWIGFLCRVGLRTTFSKEEFLSFAKEVEEKAKQEVTNTLANKSQVLTNYLLDEESLHDPGFLNDVSTIKFVVAHKADDKLDSLIKQYLFEGRTSPPCISFSNALSCKHERLVWVSAALLPSWAWPSDETVQSHLGILEKPTLYQVNSQVQKLCQKFKSKDHDLKEPICKLLLQVMSGTYQFLQEEMHTNSSTVQMLFLHLPLALVEDGRVFIPCDQLAFEMSNYEEQPPFLYKVPREFGQFESLFKLLGAFEKPCPKQYARILKVIWKQSKGETLHEEEMRHVTNAVRGLFRTLKRLHQEDEGAKTTTCSSSLQDVTALYLPNYKEQLNPSNVLYYVSCKLLTRINGADFKYNLLYDLSKMLSRLHGLVEDHLGLLPGHLQVKSLSNVLVEELHPECCNQKCEMDETHQCPNASRLRTLLTSTHLMDGIIRILGYQNRSQIDDDLRRKVESLGMSFEVVCLESLETVLKNEKGEEAEGSRAPKEYFAKEEGIKTCIYIQHGVEQHFSDICHEICTTINNQIGNAVNQENRSHLEWIVLLGLMGRQVAIPSALDSRGIERYVSESSTNLTERNILGTLIPKEFHYLLIQFEDFLFRPDEIVGYENEDGIDDEQEKYIYARIVCDTSAPTLGGRANESKKDPTTGKRKTTNPLLRKYLIDIGSETPIEVDALDLYKFKRPEEFSEPINEGTSDDQSGASASAMATTWEKAVKEVDQALAEIMELPKEQRKKALKRLYLKWHPDKKPGMEELATKVVQYIQNGFQRLSKGGKISTSSHNNADPWNGFFTNLDSRAKQQRVSYDNYKRINPEFAGGWSWYGFTPSWNPSQEHNRPDYRPPDAKMARIWLIQCRSDLETVKHLFSDNTHFYWLMCFQCNQVVEKALKGALYGVSGISKSQLESHDLTRLAYDLKSLQRAPDVVHSSGKLWKYYGATRYPHKHCPARPPKEVYTLQQALEAYEIAKDVLKTIEEFIGILHL